MHWWKIFFYLVLEKCTGAAAHIRQKAKSSDAESGDFGKVFKYRRIGVGALHAELHLLAAPLLREVHDGPAILRARGDEEGEHALHGCEDRIAVRGSEVREVEALHGARLHDVAAARQRNHHRPAGSQDLRCFPPALSVVSIEHNGRRTE